MNIIELASWIRREREDQKMTQDDLGFMIAEKDSLICDIERGRRRDPGAITLQRIAYALGYELSFTVTKRKP